MIGLSPLVGARTEDITDALKTTGVQLARQPLVTAKHVLGYASKLVDVVAGNSDYTTAKRDRRFADDSWHESGVYRRVLQAYLAMDESCDEWVEDMDLDETGERKARFVMDLLTDSLAPTNNLFTNPTAMKKALATRGGSLAQGIRHAIEDYRHNNGMPAQVDKSQFKVSEKDL